MRTNSHNVLGKIHVGSAVQEWNCDVDLVRKMSDRDTFELLML
jgi:hypothetical protein